MFVIVREDKKGNSEFVAGQNHINKTGQSWTNNILFARKFKSRAAADAERCPGNEITYDAIDLMWNEGF